MPWQRLVVDVAGEFDPVSGVPFYREVFVTTPRQSGKTLLIVSVLSDRCLSWPSPQMCVYTAQNGRAGVSKWINEIRPLLLRSELGPLVDRVRLANGSESVEWSTGSRIDLLPTSEDAGHGMVVDCAVMDEIFADADGRREQALVPAMSTRPDAQLWPCSTAGTAASTVYNQKRAAGRRAVDADSGAGMAYFEWSAPDGWDPGDEESWWGFMPALGHTIGVEAVRHAYQTLEPVEFRRAYGNVPTSDSLAAVLDPASWDAVNQLMVAPQGRLVFGVAASVERDCASVAVADAAGNVELIDRRPGTVWVVEAVARLVGSFGGEVVVDAAGPAGSLADEFGRCRRLAPREVAQACGAFYDAVGAVSGVRVRRDPQLDAAVRGLVLRRTGDAFVWSRKASTEDVTPLEAATLAWWAARPVGPAPGFYSLED